MKKILIVSSNYYPKITKDLINSIKFLLNNNKLKSKYLSVPGVYEIPVAISRNLKKYDAFIALGCVIKGETPHFDLICNSTFNGLMQLSISTKKPIGNGIITALNKKQAIKRSGKRGKGFEAAKAALYILKNV